MNKLHLVCLLFVVLLYFPNDSLSQTMLIERKEISIYPAPKDRSGKPIVPIKLAVLVHHSDVVYLEGMFIQHLFNEEEQGSFHVFSEEHIAYLDISNVLVSRDLVFANQKGIITEIFPHTIKGSRDPIVTEGLTKYLLQLNAGDTQKYGITIGDTVAWQ